VSPWHGHDCFCDENDDNYDDDDNVDNYDDDDNDDDDDVDDDDVDENDENDGQWQQHMKRVLYKVFNNKLLITRQEM